MNLRYKIIHKKNWFYALLHDIYRATQVIRIPTPHFLYSFLTFSVRWIQRLFWFSAKIFWMEPVFRTQCKECGIRLKMSTFSPFILGKGAITIGDDCRINGKLNIYFSNRFTAEPILLVGSNCSLGHMLNINISKKISIGNNVRIGGYVFITDSDGHPVNKYKRRTEPVEESNIKRVTIDEDAWIGRNSIILKGVHIGKGAIIGAGSVVTKDVPDDAIVAGNPAKFVRFIHNEKQ